MPLISLTQIALPAELALPLDVVKLFLKVDGNYDDEVIRNLVQAVSAQFERYTGCALLVQGWEAVYSLPIAESISLPVSPVHTIEKVVVQDIYNNTHSWEGFYHLIGDRLVLLSSPYGRQLKVRFNAGVARTAQEVSPDIGNALLRHIAFLYDNRGTGQGYPMEHYDEYKRYRI